MNSTFLFVGVKDIIEPVPLVLWRDLQHECKQYKLDILQIHYHFFEQEVIKEIRFLKKKKKPTILEIWMHIPR